MGKTRSHLRGTVMIRRYLWILRQLADGLALNCTEMAERLECSAKTVQRYINVLREEGWDIVYVAKLRGYVLRDDD